MKNHTSHGRPGTARLFLAVLCGWGTVAVSSLLLSLLSLGFLGTGIVHREILFTGLTIMLLSAATQLLLRPKQSAPARSSGENPDGSRGRLSAKPLDYLVSLINVSRAVSNNVPFSDLQQVIVDSCRDSFDCDEVSLMMLEPDGDELAVTAVAGHRENQKIRNARVRMGQGVAGVVAQTRSPLILGTDVDPKRFPGFERKERDIASAMIAPVVVKDEVVGVLNASSSNPDTTYTEDDLRVLCIFAEHAGIVATKTLDNNRISRVIGKMRQRNRNLAEKLAELGEAPPSGGDTEHRDAA